MTPPRPASLPSIATDVRTRIASEERRPALSLTPVKFELVLEFPSGLYNDQETRRYPVGTPFSVTGWRFAGDTAGSTTTTIIIRKNATTGATLTIAAATLFLSASLIAIGYSQGDYLQGYVSAAGTGAADFAIVLECVQ